MEYDIDGRELPDQTPVDVPLNWRRPPSMAELIRQHVRGALSNLAESHGEETFEEADDFDTGEDSDEPMTPAELASYMSDDLVKQRTKLKTQESDFKAGKVPQEYDPGPPPDKSGTVPSDATATK